MDGKYLHDMRVLLKDMLTYAYSLDQQERDSFIVEVDKTIDEINEFAKDLVPEIGEKDVKE